MIKNILVPLTGFDNDARALKAAYFIGASFAAKIVCLRVYPNPSQIIAQAALSQFGSSMGNVQLIRAIEAEGKNRTIKARQAFDEFAQWAASSGAPQANAITLAWQEIEGEPVADTIAAARYSDLIVLARAPKDGQFSVDGLTNILMRCGRPVLLAPDRPLETIGAHIAIAWKDTAEAARAVTAAMPLLSHAKRVSVISVTESASASGLASGPATHLAEQLAHHGFATDARDVALAGRPLLALVTETAHEFGADLLVMGAYSHSRFRELVLGGFTRQVLHGCDLPLLLSH